MKNETFNIYYAGLEWFVTYCTIIPQVK
jgi:hypothetical protein